MTPLISLATASDLPAIREMLAEYAAWVGVDLGFQGFDRELRELPGDYASPAGALVIARDDRTALGMVAFRRLTTERCEMKRLYVRPAARGIGLGRQLTERIVAEARERGYRELMLDTLPMMRDAQQLYVAFGFRDVAPYYSSPIAGTRFMALTL